MDVGGELALMAFNMTVSHLAGSPLSDFTVPAALLMIIVGRCRLAGTWLVHRRLILSSAGSGTAAVTIDMFEWPLGHDRLRRSAGWLSHAGGAIRIDIPTPARADFGR
jgi:hypothetical protein